MLRRHATDIANREIGGPNEGLVRVSEDLIEL